MAKRYKLMNLNILDHPVAPYIIRLMMGSTAMHAGWRWSNTVSDCTADVSYGDFLLSAITTAGWTYETIVVIRDTKKEGFISRQMLAGCPELESYWDDSIVVTKDKRLDLLKKIRNQFFGHFDKRSACAAVKVSRDREKTPDFAQETEDHIPMFPMGLLAFEHWLGCDPNSSEQVKAKLPDVTNAISLTLKLVDRLLAELVDEYGIEVVQQ